MEDGIIPKLVDSLEENKNELEQLIASGDLSDGQKAMIRVAARFGYATGSCQQALEAKGNLHAADHYKKHYENIMEFLE